MAAKSTRPRTPISTSPEHRSIRRLRRDRLLRRIFLGLLGVIVALALLGVFGYRTGSVTAAGEGYSLRLRYPAVGRPGVPIVWTLEIHHDGGLPPELTVATSVGLLDLLDLNDVEPVPTSTTTTGREVLWTFATPKGDDMVITIDAIVQPNAHRGVRATTTLIVDGERRASVSYQTRVAI